MGSERYVILGTLGRDPTGASFLALESELDQRVVYKRYAEELADDQAFVSGLRQEARIMALFDHPNLVCVLDFITEPELALVTEFVRGASLRAAIEAGGRMTPTQALGTVKGTLNGLAYAHDLGMVHRDIRPENVLADEEGTVKLTAFGQTPKLLGRSRVRNIPGRIAAYMSPERLAGGAVGPGTDIYSCGALLYKLLTGQQPYEGDDLRAILRQQIDQPTPDPGILVRSLPSEVSALVTRAMEQAPEDRPESADLFLHELEVAAVAAFGPDWESRSSIKRLVSVASDADGGLSLDAEAQSEESTEDLGQARVSRGRRYIAIGAAMLVLLASAGALAYSRGLITLPGSTASAGTTSGQAQGASPSADTSPTPSPSPSASPSPASVPAVQPSQLKRPSGRPPVAVTRPVLWFQPCSDAGITCFPPVNGTGVDAAHPYDASAYPYIRLMDVFSWTFTSGGDDQVIKVSWTAKALTGASSGYPVIFVQRTVTYPSGAQSPDVQGQELILSASSPSKSIGSFTITYTDASGPHSISSAPFYWTH